MDVLVDGEGGDGPVEGGHVQFVDGLGVGGGEHAHGASVEGAVEREDAEVGAAGRLVHHARAHILGGEVALALLLPVPHEDGLVGVLVGARAARHRRDLVEPLGRHPQQHVLQHRVPVGAREHPQRRPVHDCFLFVFNKIKFFHFNTDNFFTRLCGLSVSIFNRWGWL
jgi:muconolactone delta-isomerase